MRFSRRILNIQLSTWDVGRTSDDASSLLETSRHSLYIDSKTRVPLVRDHVPAGDDSMDRDVLMEAVRSRHSVRSYDEKPLSEHERREMERIVDVCNAEGHLKCALVLDSPEAFAGTMSRVAKFSNVRNYVVVMGSDRDGLDERGGYWGEMIALKAQNLGLRTCWVGLTYSKRKLACDIPDGVRVVSVIALGHGMDDGVAHRSKPMEELALVNGEPAEWFDRGMESVMLAPSAMNRQGYRFTLRRDGKVEVKSFGGSYSQVDLGIAKLHFEIGSGKGPDVWA